ncbi:MAG TPA: helix-turn-helix domain-containing protein [Polyangia bacterium]
MDDGTSLGAKLRQARESRGLTLEAIAASTRIPVPLLEHIENDAYSDLPADVYLRGFVRSYCRAVQLPEPAALELLDKALVHRKNLSAAGAPPLTPEEVGRPLMPVMQIGALGRQRIKVLGGVLAFAVLALLIWLMA